MNRPHEDLDESLLVLRCRLGDAGAFEALVGRYTRRLGIYLHKLLGDPHVAEDLLQDVWLDAYRHLRRLDDPAALRPWLYRIARDKAYAALRRRRITVSLNGEHEEPTAAPSDEALHADDIAAVSAAIDALAPPHREVLLLRFVEDFSYEQIAQVTGQPVGTVRSRLHYAKATLRKALENSANFRP